jgi:hypothetical protein
MQKIYFPDDAPLGQNLPLLPMFVCGDSRSQSKIGDRNELMGILRDYVQKVDRVTHHTAMARQIAISRSKDSNKRFCLDPASGKRDCDMMLFFRLSLV